MNVTERAKRAGWNINSWIGLIVGALSICSSVGVVLWATANKSRDIEELQVWRAGQETRNGRVDERMKAIEDRQASSESDVKLLTQRTQANEQAVGQILSSIKELTTSINEVSGDVKVMRAILQRQDTDGRTEIR